MKYTFAPLPMAEAQAFWANKVQLSPKEFRTLSAEAKLRAFAVGGIAKGDQLASIYQALQAAIDSGISFGDFKKQIRPIIERRGWTGPKAWRVDNIFRTNLQTAYGVGRYKQMAEVARLRPFWMYDAVNDSRTRPTHAAMDGKVFPADHSFWDKWYPPNGFRCRCTVVSLTAAQVKARGLKIEEADPSGKLVEPRDPVTGVKMPARLLMPDPGFAYNPGASFWGPLLELTKDKVEAWPAPIARDSLSSLARGAVFRTWYEAPEGTFPLARLDDDSAALIGAETRTVQLSAETAGKQKDRHPELPAEEYGHVQTAITNGRRIQDTDRSLVFVLEEAQGYVTVVKSTETGRAVFLSSFRRLPTEAARRDREISRLLAKGEKK